MTGEMRPPLGVRLTIDIEEHPGKRGATYWARARWTDPLTHHREGVKRAHPSREAAEAWVRRMENWAASGLDTGSTLAAYVEHYRATVEGKCRGLTPAQVRTRSMPPSRLSKTRILPFGMKSGSCCRMKGPCWSTSPS